MSGKPKWTPGPWRVDSAGLIYDSGNHNIAHGRYSNYLREDEQRANSNLIAAAPRLYKELDDMVALAESAMREANKDGGEYDVEAELADARVALALARGEVSP